MNYANELLNDKNIYQTVGTMYKLIGTKIAISFVIFYSNK